MTRRRPGSILVFVKWNRILVCTPTVLFAALVILAAAPLLAGHTHGHADASSALHAPCAACQVHAPGGTPPDAEGLVVEPDRFSPAVDIHTDGLLCDPHGRLDACRAPPRLLAI